MREDETKLRVRQYMSEWSGAAYFDLDGTLLDARSEMTFFREYRKIASIGKRLLLPIRWSIGTIGGLLSGKAPYDAFRNRHYIHGVEWNLIEEISQKIVADTLISKVSFEARERIEWHRSQGHRLVLLSATLQPLCDEFSQRLGMDASIASLPALDGNGCVIAHESAGRFPRRRGKLPFVLADVEEHGLDLASCWGYGNEFADVFFMEVCGHPEAVNPSSRLRRKAKSSGWPIHQWKTED